MLRSLLTFVVLMAVIIVGVAFAFGYIVPPGYMGVRQITIGPKQGFGTIALKPGYHWGVPFYSRVHLIPSTIRVLDIHRQGDAASNALEVPTKDGPTVDVDISVLSRFFNAPDSQQHGGPADLIKSVGLNSDDWNNHIRRVAGDELRRALGELSTGEFYDPYARQRQLDEAFKNIGERLNPAGIEIDGVLLRRFTYRSERIDKSIFDKNLQDQEARLNTAASLLAGARATLEQASAEWDAKIKSLQVEGQNRANVLQSQGRLYEDQRIAEGDLLVAKAKAEVDRLRAGALSQISGSEIYVARSLAPLLGSIKGGVISNINPYDLDAWVKKLEGTK